MAINQTTLVDEDGDYSDWIEIYNPTSGPVNLQGWALTDDIRIPFKWVFPDITLEANEYLIVFASGKGRSAPGSELHTNFNLNGAGEYLALFNLGGEAVTEFSSMYPEQLADVSYGFYVNTYIQFVNPTPGTDNNESGTALLPPPVFNKKHGFYESPFDLEITTDIQDAEIFYTTDGSAPSESNGSFYTTPIAINTTTIIRAVIVIDDEVLSKVTTCTYLFLDDVIHQPNDPPGYPDMWGPYVAIEGNAIADYEMDPEMMTDTAFAHSVKEALLDIPTISLATDKNNFFLDELDSVTGGIYIYPGAPGDERGRGWERPVSFEYFDNTDSISLQVDCGVRIHGGHSRRPEKSPKHSLRLVFKSQYGPPKLNYPFFGDEAASRFNTLVLNAGFNNTWVHHSASQREHAQYIHNIWGKDTQRDMGHIFVHGNFVHLYLNEIYWGVYRTFERIDRRFAASYFEGEEENFDVIKDYVEVIDGDIDAWNTMMEMANAGLESNEAYQRIQGNNPDGTPNPDYKCLVDVVNIIDYMLINFYGANTDWDHHNWAAVYNRVNPGAGFKFLSWDEESILGGVNQNILNENNDNRPSRIFQQLLKNEDFRRLFADRVQKHCYNNGALTPQSTAARWIKRRDQVEKAVIAESARWGDYRRDVHQYQTIGPFDLYTKEDHWLAQQNFLLNTYFPNRTDVFLSHLRSAGLFPTINAPTFFINDNLITHSIISAGDELSITANEGTIYFTIDGTDPVAPQSSEDNNEFILVSEDADKRVIVPQSDIGDTWFSVVDYNDSRWKVCSGTPGGIGYEKGSGYEEYITLDVGDDMHDDGGNPNTSCYIRIPFTVNTDSLTAYTTLILSVRYDDGFAAFINGTKVAASYAPESLAWNSTAAGSHEAGMIEIFNISQHIGKLADGENLLAIQGLNRNTSSSDFLITAQLKAGKQFASGEPSEYAMIYSDPLLLNESYYHIKARAYNNGEWSALQERFFVNPGSYTDVKVTEIHYHPLGEDTVDDGEFEFIELKNTGTSTVYLGGMQFIKGMYYTFAHGSKIASKEFIVLASDTGYFYDRYGFLPFDEYKGQLDNNGEWIVLISDANDTICSFYYGDNRNWPSMPDGLGYSLVSTELDPTNDQNSSAYWRASYTIGGSPGADDLPVFIAEEMKPEDIFMLHQNYPNPFSGNTFINYQIPIDAHITLSVYNIVGQHVITLIDEWQAAGPYQVEWKGNNSLANGVYVYRMTIESQYQRNILSRKMIMMK